MFIIIWLCQIVENSPIPQSDSCNIRQTSKDVGVNVEGYLWPEWLIHTFAMSKDRNNV